MSFTTLFSFGADYTNTDGTSPSAALVQGKDGYLYGTTPSGGAKASGTVFRISTNGIYTTLVSFAGTNGANPVAGLVQGADGNFYGTTTAGGTYNLGTVFKMTSGGTLTTLASFNGTNGATPSSVLVQTPNGVLYGVTEYGGANDLDFGGDGAVFKITTNGVLTRIYSFANGHGWRQFHRRPGAGQRRQSLRHHPLRRDGLQRLGVQGHDQRRPHDAVFVHWRQRRLNPDGRS